MLPPGYGDNRAFEQYRQKALISAKLDTTVLLARRSNHEHR
jgi:hypothetical protein